MRKSRDQFRMYLHSSGTLEALKVVLARAYSLDEWPVDPIDFISQSLSSVREEIIDSSTLGESIGISGDRIESRRKGTHSDFIQKDVKKDRISNQGFNDPINYREVQQIIDQEFEYLNVYL